MELIAILAMDHNNGIGIDNKLPWKIKEEMDFFKEKTLNNIVVMGKNTFLSLKKPLKNRINIILTNDKQFIEDFNSKKAQNIEGYDSCFIKHSLEFIEEFKKIDVHKKMFIIGGKNLYDQLLNQCDSIYLSVLNEIYHCNVFMDYDFEKHFEIKDIKTFEQFTNYYLTKKNF